MTWVNRYAVESDSTDAVYVVGIDETGNWGCSCPGARYHVDMNGKRDCKHIRRLRQIPPKKRQTVDSYKAAQEQQASDFATFLAMSAKYDAAMKKKREERQKAKLPEAWQPKEEPLLQKPKRLIELAD